MEVGERQKKLSRWAEADRSKRFDDLFDLLHQEDGRRTAQKHVQQHAGCRTAGGEGVTMRGFEEDLEGNLRRRREGAALGRVAMRAKLVTSGKADVSSPPRSLADSPARRA